jgi:glutathione S-transferase
MFYLSEATEFFPTDKFERSQVMQWLFFEQYSHEPFIATSRFWYMTGKAEEYREALQQKQAPGYAALAVMEQHLENHAFFVGDRYTIADIGLFAYTHVAGEGGFDLTKFPAIETWIDRVKSQPAYQHDKFKLNLNFRKKTRFLHQYLSERATIFRINRVFFALVFTDQIDRLWVARTHG